MISVVIPVYRSAEILPELHRRLDAVLREVAPKYEIIFVEDCGGDSSWETIKSLARDNPAVQGFQMSRNYGQHNALLCGIREAEGSIIVTMDDDLQHSPEDLPKLLSKLNEGYDVVYASPKKEQHSLWRNLASQVTKIMLQKAMGTANARSVSAFRAFRAELKNGFADYRSPTVNIDVLLTWATTQFTAVAVDYKRREINESGYTTRKLIRHALNMMTGFSTRPLHIASVTGFGFAAFGFIILAYVIANWLWRGDSVPGFAFLASIIAIFSGVQLLALGIIGEYIARMHLRTMERPPYVIRSRFSASQDPHK